MIKQRLALLALSFSLPLAVSGAELTIGDLPEDTVWYMHANLKEMRNSDSGSRVYAWFEDEVVVEINEELGIDLNSEVDSVTAFSDSTNGTVMIIEGPITKRTQEKMLAVAHLESTVETRNYKGMDYYYIGDGPEGKSRDNDPFEDLEDVFVFKLCGKWQGDHYR